MFFFFKQKTAYEMRISDWSSDMCSSDLDERRLPAEPLGQQDQTGQDKAGRRHLREPEAEDRLAQGPQPPRMQFEPDEEKQEGDPDFGDRELRFAAADQPQSIGSDERAGDQKAEIGRASGRERVRQYGALPVVAVSVKKKNMHSTLEIR